MEPVKHVSRSFSQKSERLIAENNFCKKFHLRCFKSINLTQNTSSLFSKLLRHRTIKLRRIKILKTSCRKLSILLKFWLNDAYGRGWGSTCLRHYDALPTKIDMWLLTLEYWSRNMLKFDFFRKGSRNSFSTTFFVWFFKKNVSHVIQLTDKISLSDWFTGWDIGQYVYCNCFLPRLRRHKLGN